MSFEDVLLERGGAVAVLINNRPHVLNPLNSSTLNQWQRAVVDLTHDAAAHAVVKRKANVTGR
jgi:enoyl-CoA hydratase/carnithine racemase